MTETRCAEPDAGWIGGYKAHNWERQGATKTSKTFTDVQQAAPMKTSIVLASLALSALAQQAVIVSPVNGSDITAGSTLVVDVHQAVRTILRLYSTGAAILTVTIELRH